mmetsp:Transcript_6498/g.10105  ORF Transcript_6498/g.10105 Transcript_6498/m.10105 type:complete len:210 (-) Transcript_6498:329-958(-)
MVKGTLTVVIGASKDLKNTAPLFTKMDVYCVAEVSGGESYKTSIKKRAGKNPSFDEQFQFDILPSSNPVLIITLYDRNKVGGDSLIGGTELNFGEMAFQGKSDESWFPLKRSNGKNAGEIFLKLSFLPAGAPAPLPLPHVETEEEKVAKENLTNEKMVGGAKELEQMTFKLQDKLVEGSEVITVAPPTALILQSAPKKRSHGCQCFPIA